MLQLKLILAAAAVTTMMTPLAASARWLDDHNHHQTGYLVQSTPIEAGFSTGRMAELPTSGEKLNPNRAGQHYVMLGSNASAASDTQAD